MRFVRGGWVGPGIIAAMHGDIVSRLSKKLHPPINRLVA